MFSSNDGLTNLVCWTRMQAESGEDIRSIIARKEIERRAGNGLFFWGIGNAPSRSIKSLASKSEDIDVVFSLMKTRPKMRDAAPTGVLVWRTYFDLHDVEHPIPRHVLVTSRMAGGSAQKRVHYALMCRSDEELRLGDYGSFDPSVYRNIGDAGGPVGHSQVTALVIRTRTKSQLSDYRVNLRARLAGSYWVRLGQPCVLGQDSRAAITIASARAGEIGADDWIKIIPQFKFISPPFTGQQSFPF